MTYLQAEINFESGAVARDAGIAKAVNHAEAVIPGWAEKAYQFLVNDFLQNNKQFMCEDVRAYAAMVDFPLPPVGMAWGGIIRRAAYCNTEKNKFPYIIKVGTKSVKNPKAHCANAAVWERNCERMIENGLM